MQVDVLAPGFSEVGKGHEDRRRGFERVIVLADGTTLRETVLVANPAATKPVILGRHKHPGSSDEHPHGCREKFDVVAGRTAVFTAPNIGQERLGASYVLEIGDTLTVDGGMAHTFVCAPGTVLVVTTDWQFVEGVSIIPCDFDMTAVPDYEKAMAALDLAAA